LSVSKTIPANQLFGAFIIKGKGKDPARYVLVPLTEVRLIIDRQHFTILKVAANWYEPTIPQCIIQPSTACANEELDARCSQQTYHHPSQPH